MDKTDSIYIIEDLQPSPFHQRSHPHQSVDCSSTQWARVYSWVDPWTPRRPQTMIHPAIQRQMVKIRWFQRQLGTVQGPHACGQTPWLPARQCHEDAHSTGAQVATENLSQDFPRLFPLVSETSHTFVDHTSHATLSSFIHPHTLCIHVLIVWPISKGEGYCDTAVRTKYVLPVTSPVSHLTQTSFTTHSVQYTQYTLSVHISSYHPSLCVDASLL